MAISRGLSSSSADSDSSSASAPIQSGSRKLLLLGLLSVILYTANGEILQAATSGSLPGARCSAMLLMTLCHSSAVLVIPWFALFRNRDELGRFAEILSPGGSISTVSLLICVLSLLLLLPNYLWTKSTSYQPVGTTNAILQTSVGFSYIGSQVFLHGASGESCTTAKTCAVLLAMAGSLLGLLEPSGSGTAGASAASTSPMLGASLALGASAAQAAYQIFSKRRLLPIKDRLDCIALLWAGIALVHILVFLPLVLFVWPLVPAWAGGEMAEFPDVREQPRAFGAVMATVCIAGTVNAINTVVAVRGSPLLLSMAYTLVLPGSRVADWAVHGIRWTAAQVAGDALILVSLGIMGGVREERRGTARRGQERGAAEELERLQSSLPDDLKGV